MQNEGILQSNGSFNRFQMVGVPAVPSKPQVDSSGPWQVMKQLKNPVTGEKVLRLQTLVLGVDRKDLVFKSATRMQGFAIKDVSHFKVLEKQVLEIHFGIMGKAKNVVHFFCKEDMQGFIQAFCVERKPKRISQGQGARMVFTFTESMYGQIMRSKAVMNWQKRIKMDKYMIVRENPGIFTFFKLWIGKITSGEDHNGIYSSMQKGSRYILHPMAPLAIFFGLLSGIFLLYTAIVLPFTLAFFWDLRQCENSPTLYIDMLVDVYFIFEIVLAFFVGRQTRQGYLDNHRSIAKDYMLSGDFAFDIFTSLPIAWLEFAEKLTCDRANSNSRVYLLLRVLRVLKPWRLIRLLKIMRLNSKKVMNLLYNSMMIKPDSVRLTNLAFGVLMCIHLGSCFFWMIKYHTHTAIELGEFMLEYNISEPAGCDPDDKICRCTNAWSIFLTCFYFVTTVLTTVGFGDINATNDAERIFVVLLELCGTVRNILQP